VTGDSSFPSCHRSAGLVEAAAGRRPYEGAWYEDEARYLNRPRSMATVPSPLAVRNEAVPSAPRQIETTNESPGVTGAVNLPDIAMKFAGSAPHS
jgi:hypothetical protein